MKSLIIFLCFTDSFCWYVSEVDFAWWKGLDEDSWNPINKIYT
ncbi:hypothetical protein GcM3_c13375o20 [Golovinomyces cichoracearum]|uniref:Uncharacterized protein n=1 Tax=Golovinomyces cichoracearum TaxID=62708 RepID=A0A420J5U1_9PEZI|nr:hypothetical protein GcM3_c13375o20 [Golovinomyces cichoracearum]